MDRKERTRIRRMIDSSMLIRHELQRYRPLRRGLSQERLDNQVDKLVRFKTRCWEAIQRGKGRAVPPIVED